MEIELCFDRCAKFKVYRKSWQVLNRRFKYEDVVVVCWRWCLSQKRNGRVDVVVWLKR